MTAIPLTKDQQTILAADTPIRLDPPAARITSVRGGLGAFQNQDSGAGDRLDYSGEEAPKPTLKVRVVQDGADAVIMRGPMASQTFDGASDVDPVTDQITITGHGFHLGDGPVHFTGAGIPDGINVFATGTLTLTGNASNGDIVTIDAKVYTFQDTLTDVDGNVHIGATASDTLDNLIAAITLGSGAGTDYATSMTEHPSVTAVAGAGDTMDVTAKNEGAVGNVTSTTDISGATWTAATLTGGTDVDYFVIPVDANTIQIATSRANAFAGTAVNVTADGSGTVTVRGDYNVNFPPAASLQDGSAGWLLLNGQSYEFDLDGPFTIVGDTNAVTQFQLSG